jgi:hypothetical protein
VSACRSDQRTPRRCSTRERIRSITGAGWKPARAPGQAPGSAGAATRTVRRAEAPHAARGPWLPRPG